MNIQTLIIYKFTDLYQVLKEIEKELNYIIVEYLDEKTLKKEIKNIKNYLIVVKQKSAELDYQYVVQPFPITLTKLLEKLNIEILKNQFSNQSKVKINNYLVDLNSREISIKDLKLKLTEKEISIILHLSKIKNPVTIDELKKKVWLYRNDIETHTVETHIYRLRKKIFNIFNDDDFIISSKNGYYIK
tara:strand:- start:439 stop:1002 length:564 start_codon:yes stop_codon:yes gene_type:complete